MVSKCKTDLDSQRILFLEPYYGGSHKNYIDGYIQHSQHTFDLLTLPARKWKWRMRHAAISLSQQIKTLHAQGKRWDLVFCTDMLNLAEWKGLVPEEVSRLPAITYFHENQLTYPSLNKDPRDHHFAFINFISAHAADEVWFNSAWHRDDFLGHMKQLLRKMPDYPLTEEMNLLNHKSVVQSPGIWPSPDRKSQNSEPVLLFAARWEHDKNPELFFSAIEELDHENLPFRLNIIGESFERQPEIFELARQKFQHRFLHWGYQETKRDYQKVLAQSDIVISTARHEYFGIGMLEAVEAGCFPLLPDALAYPETMGSLTQPDRKCFLYPPEKNELVKRLKDLIKAHRNGQLWGHVKTNAQTITAPYLWEKRAREMDLAIDALHKRKNS